MRSNALYFPYISLPPDAWTARTLLYWDKLSSIVPVDHLDDPEQLPERMRRLLAEGLVEPIIPARFVYQIREFDERFIDMLDKHRSLPKHALKTKDAPFKTTRIHAEKLGRIPEYLIDVGLAKQDGYPWYDVEESTAHLFMSYLAVCLSALPEVDAAPVTNHTRVMSMMMPPRGITNAQALHRRKAREVALNHLLPMPTQPVDIDQLVHFKQRHGHLLPDLRAKVEAHCIKVSTHVNPDDRMTLNEAFIREVQQQVREIDAAMQQKLGPTTLGSLLPLFGAGLAVQGTDPSSPIVYAGAALSFVGTAYAAINSIRAPRLDAAAKPLAYFAMAQRTFSGQQPNLRGRS